MWKRGTAAKLIVGSRTLYCPHCIAICYYVPAYNNHDNNDITACVLVLNEKTAYNAAIKFNGKYRVVVRRRRTVARIIIIIITIIIFYKLRLFRLLIYILLFMDNDNNIVVVYKIYNIQ